VLSNSFQLGHPDLVRKNVNIPDPLYKIFTLCLQFEPELPEEEADKEEEADMGDEAAVQEEEDAVREDEAAAAMPPPTGTGPRERPPTRRSRFWSEGQEPLTKGLPYTGRPL